MDIRLSGYITESIVDGPGIRSVIFTQGCLHNCPGCHNPKTHDLNKGKLINVKEIVNLVSQNPLAKGLTISGGEPFLQPNEILEVINEYKNINPNKDILIYTGFTIDELWKMNDEIVNKILSIADILIDGRFILSKRDLSLLYRGSTNQRIIDLKKTTKDNIVLKEFN